MLLMAQASRIGRRPGLPSEARPPRAA
jgi:hypothetical protein